MNGTALESINEQKDLGIFITDDLKWSTHCQQAYARANKFRGTQRPPFPQNESQHNILKLLCCDSVWGKGGRCVPP